MLGSLCHQSSHDTHYLLVIDHQILSALINSTISAHSLLVRSTVHIPELSQTPCAYLCVSLTSDVPDSPPLQPFHMFPARKQRTVTSSQAIWISSHCALLASRNLLVLSSVSFNKYPCLTTYLCVMTIYV